MDEDETESSIFDLDHAPAPPEDRPTNIAVGLGGSASWNHRRRSSTGGGSVGSTSSNHTSNYPPALTSVKSYPPSERSGSAESKMLGEKKVGFVDMYPTTDRGMLQLPEVSMESEESMYGYESAAPELAEPAEQSSRPKYHSRSESQTSMFSASEKSGSEDFPEDIEDGDPNSSMAESGPRRVFFLGFKLPLWCTQSPSWTRVAYCIVTKSPCFWGCGIRTQIAPTDRAILARLNLLVAFFALFQVGSTLFLAILFYSPAIADRSLPTQTDSEQTSSSGLGELVNIWNLNSTIFVLGLIAFGILVAYFLTVRTIRNVNLIGAIRYLWVLLWVIPFEIYFIIALFDYFRVTKTWIRQAWRSPTLAWFRERYCAFGTARTLCTVPISDNETQWCLENYQAVTCTAIRDSAQLDMRRMMFPYYYLNAAWGLFLIILLLLVVNTLESIISKPLVQKSRESNVPAWLSLPIVGCLTLGGIFAFSEESVLATNVGSGAGWIGPVYLVTAGLFFCAAMVGWSIKAVSILSIQHKRQKVIAVNLFIVLMAATLILLLTTFAASIALSVRLVDVPIDDDARGSLACFLDAAGSCTGCELEENRCPEWSVVDVTRVLQTQAKGSAALAAIFLMHSFSALRFGFGLRRHIKMYQIDYV